MLGSRQVVAHRREDVRRFDVRQVTHAEVVPAVELLHVLRADRRDPCEAEGRLQVLVPRRVWTSLVGMRAERLLVGAAGAVLDS